MSARAALAARLAEIAETDDLDRVRRALFNVADVRALLDETEPTEFGELVTYQQMTAPTPEERKALQTLRDYLGMASGGTKTDAELWEFAEEALSDLAGFHHRGPITDAEARARILRETAESYVYVHAVSRTSSRVYQWLQSRADAALEAAEAAR